MLDRSKFRLMARTDRLLWVRRGDYVKEWWFRRHDWMGWRVGRSVVYLDPGHVGPKSSTAREVKPVPKKPDGALSQAPQMKGADMGLWGKSMPLLADWLCAAAWGDGTPLGKTRLSMWRAGTEVVACLQLADLGGVRLEARAEHPQAALAELEQLLALPAVPWQLDPYPIGQSGKRKK